MGGGDLFMYFFTVWYLKLTLLWMLYWAEYSYQSLGYLCRTYSYLLLIYMMAMDYGSFELTVFILLLIIYCISSMHVLTLYFIYSKCTHGSYFSKGLFLLLIKKNLLLFL